MVAHDADVAAHSGLMPLPDRIMLVHMVKLPGDGGRATTAGDAMAVVDARGIITGWSESARLLTGTPRRRSPVGRWRS
jgi:hypothetical protein